MKTEKNSTPKVVRLSHTEKIRLIQSHEDGSDVYILAKKYAITPASVAAYVANAHRG